MASASILGTSYTGDWPRAGDLGHYIKAQVANTTANPLLPSGVSCAWNTLPTHREDTSGSTALMLAPGFASRLSFTWGGFTSRWIEINAPSPVIISVHAYVTGSGFGAVSWSLLDSADDSVLASVSDVSASASMSGFWFTARVQGSIKLNPTNANMRASGLIFTSATVASRLIRRAAGRSGLVRVG